MYTLAPQFLRLLERHLLTGVGENVLFGPLVPVVVAKSNYIPFPDSTIRLVETKLYRHVLGLTDGHKTKSHCGAMGLKPLGGHGAMRGWGCDTKPIPRGFPRPAPC